MHQYRPPDAVREQATHRSGKEWVHSTVDGPRAALVVVDMQNYYCQSGSQGETPVARAIVPNINRAARALRQAGGLVVWIQTSSADAMRLWGNFHRTMLAPARKDLRLAGLSESGNGFALVDGLESQAGDMQVIKVTYSAFGPATPDLHALLQARGIDTVLIAGTLTNVCCETTARHAVILDYNVIMLSDANAARSDEAHAATLNNFMIFFGEVMTVENAMSRMTGAPGSAAVRAV